MLDRRLNALLEAWTLLTRRVSDLEGLVNQLAGKMVKMEGRIRARLKEEADAVRLG